MNAPTQRCTDAARPTSDSPGEARVAAVVLQAGVGAAPVGDANARVMVLLDALMTEAARSRFGDGRSVTTVDLHLSFMREPAGPLSGTARVMGGGRSLSFCEATLRDAEGRGVAQALGTYRHADPRPATGPA